MSIAKIKKICQSDLERNLALKIAETAADGVNPLRQHKVT